VHHHLSDGHRDSIGEVRVGDAVIVAGDHGRPVAQTGSSEAVDPYATRWRTTAAPERMLAVGRVARVDRSAVRDVKHDRGTEER